MSFIVVFLNLGFNIKLFTHVSLTGIQMKHVAVEFAFRLLHDVSLL